MVSRTTVMTLPLALGLLLAGCSAPAEDQASESPSVAPTAEATAEPTAQPSQGEAGSEEDPADTSTAVEDLPDYLKTYPDATVLSSTREKAEASADAEALDQVSLVMSATAEADDIFRFYAEALEKAGFETYGDEVKTDDARVVNFRHKDNDGLLVVTISKDPADDANSIVTVGGTVVP
ncbi:hypothetical protein DFO66_11851 [Brevibacterium sanguinis]|uniref:Uncharacterized protein n=2 Tax=Brevibacterium TaxID=1696 RepID=A0A366IF72_9MICO|nr:MULTISPECIES: hypothetical protein [Brevibacterium]RBP61917.1 hypothetical protein DFO66_11851 [Brevibacterium sanguinis]RBP68637.1 hypothetical protein DFO65_1166 [Brevibacterium celere]